MHFNHVLVLPPGKAVRIVDACVRLAPADPLIEVRADETARFRIESGP
jgi:hypothetical protein